MEMRAIPSPTYVAGTHFQEGGMNTGNVIAPIVTAVRLEEP